MLKAKLSILKDLTAKNPTMEICTMALNIASEVNMLGVQTAIKDCLN
jgi:hypothetical protein